jgi:CRISPR/Cas system-associated protein endoribonuclease Cas2
LKKSLYSLKLPPRQWCKRFNTFMLKHGYFMSDYDNFVYFRKLLDGLYVLVIVY